MKFTQHSIFRFVNIIGDEIARAVPVFIFCFLIYNPVQVLVVLAFSLHEPNVFISQNHLV